MRSISVIGLLLLMLAVSAEAGAMDCAARRHHAWGKFTPGSWKRVRVRSEVFDQRQNLVSTAVTETTTTLVAADDREYKLRVEVAVEIGGRRLPSRPQILRRGYYGERPGQEVSEESLGEVALEINGRRIPCDARKVTVRSDEVVREITLYCNDQILPHVLKRETTARRRGDEQPHSVTEAVTEAIQMPHEVLGQIRTAAMVKTHHQSEEGETLSLEVHCADVPGGVVAHSSRELDSEGNLERRSTLELVDFYVAPREMEMTSAPAGRRHFFLNFLRRLAR